MGIFCLGPQSHMPALDLSPSVPHPPPPPPPTQKNKKNYRYGFKDYAGITRMKYYNFP